MLDIEVEEPVLSRTSLESPTPQNLSSKRHAWKFQDRTASQICPHQLVQGPHRLPGLCITRPALQPSLENHMTSC